MWVDTKGVNDMKIRTIYFYIAGSLLLLFGSMALDNSRTIPQFLALLSVVFGGYIIGLSNIKWD